MRERVTRLTRPGQAPCYIIGLFHSPEGWTWLIEVFGYEHLAGVVHAPKTYEKEHTARRAAEWFAQKWLDTMFLRDGTKRIKKESLL